MRDSGLSRRGKRFLFVVRARYITIPLCETATLTFNIRQSAPPPRKEGKSGGLFHFSGSERTRRQPATMPTAQINNPTISLQTALPYRLHRCSRVLDMSCSGIYQFRLLLSKYNALVVWYHTPLNYHVNGRVFYSGRTASNLQT